jgi:hypothetical protein
VHGGLLPFHLRRARHPRGEPGGATDRAGGVREPADDDPDSRVWPLFDFVAARYGWTVEQVRATLTDEQFAGYLEAAGDAVSERAEADWERMVEAVRTGYVIARSQKAATRWDARHAQPMTPQSAEQQMRLLMKQFPDNVKMPEKVN